MRYLPNETWLDILKFVGYRGLAERVSIVDRRFSALADLLYHQQMWPRDVELIVIDLTKKYSAQSLNGLLIWKNETVERPPPITPAPANIKTIKWIHIKGLFEPTIFDYLAMYRTKFGQHINLCFHNPANFITSLVFAHVPVEKFFEIFGSSDQNTITIKASTFDDSPYDPSPVELPGPEFFLSAPVLACRKMEIWLPITNIDSPHGVLSWLTTPFGDQEQFRHLIIIGPKENENDQFDQSLAKLIDKLVSRHIEAQFLANFVLEIRGTLVDLKEFRNDKLSLTRSADSKIVWIVHGNSVQQTAVYMLQNIKIGPCFSTTTISVDDLQIFSDSTIRRIFPLAVPVHCKICHAHDEDRLGFEVTEAFDRKRLLCYHLNCIPIIWELCFRCRAIKIV